MQELGYVASRDIDIVYRYADGDLARLPALVDELVRLKPDVLIAVNTETTRRLSAQRRAGAASKPARERGAAKKLKTLPPRRRAAI